LFRIRLCQISRRTGLRLIRRQLARWNKWNFHRSPAELPAQNIPKSMPGMRLEIRKTISAFHGVIVPRTRFEWK